MLYLVLAGLVGIVFHDQLTQRATIEPAQAVADSQGNRVESRLDAAKSASVLPSTTERAGLGEAGPALFAPHSWQAPAPQIVASPPAPVAPPLPYRFAGTFTENGTQQVLLAKGDAVVPVKLGETLDGAYLVESIRDSEIVLQYLPLGVRQTIPVNSAIAVAALADAARSEGWEEAAKGGVQAPPSGAAPLATLEWSGPQRVRLGEPFDVALKMNSSQLVQSAPLQLRFDPAVLESLAVRPGRFFGAARRQFTHRVNSDGTIFVGASVPVAVKAADAELLVVTFKAVSATPEASLAVMKLGLLGPDGKPVATEQLTAYRTTIVR